MAPVRLHVAVKVVVPNIKNTGNWKHGLQPAVRRFHLDPRPMLTPPGRISRKRARLSQSAEVGVAAAHGEAAAGPGLYRPCGQRALGAHVPRGEGASAGGRCGKCHVREVEGVVFFRARGFLFLGACVWVGWGGWGGWGVGVVGVVGVVGAEKGWAEAGASKHGLELPGSSVWGYLVMAQCFVWPFLRRGGGMLF